jgi:hypothetical protein
MAEILGVDVARIRLLRTARGRRQRGAARLPFVKIGREFRYRLEDLEGFVELPGET